MAEGASRRVQGKEERRGRVLEAAMKMADRGGYDAVQMRAVAEESGVALGTIYRYFSGKDEMLIAGLAGWVAHTRHRIESSGVAGDTPAERLHNLVSTAAASTDTHPVLMGALVTASGTTARSACEAKLEVEEELTALVVLALGMDEVFDSEGIARVIGHVWTSALTRWVGGLAPDGSVGAELGNAVDQMLGSRVPAVSVD